MTKTLQFEEDLVRRMEDINRADIGQPESEAFRMADAAMQEMLASAAMEKAVATADKSRILVTVVVDGGLLRILSNLHPNYEFVNAPISKPIGAEVEAMRDAVVCALSEKIYIPGETMIHVGGTAIQHIPYSRVVHCEFPSYTVAAEAARERRRRDLLTLFKEITKVNTAMGSDALQFEVLHRTQKTVACAAATCTVQAPSMLFDILAVPLSQLQLCAAMAMHEADVAEIMLPVEDQSLGGAAGIIPGTAIRAVYDASTDLINYDAAIGCVEFPPTPRSVVIEYLHKACVQHAGSTFKFELQEQYGFFQRITVTRVRELVTLDVTHSRWVADAEDSVRITLPRLRALGLDPEATGSYYDASVVVGRSLFTAAHSYAMSLERKTMSVSLIRTKIASINDRVVVKGTTVELHAPLDPTVLDVTSLGVFLIAFEDRFLSAEGFRRGSAEVTKLRDTGAQGFIRDAVCALNASLSKKIEGFTQRNVEPWLKRLDGYYAKRMNLQTVSVRSEVLRTDFRSIVFGNIRDPSYWVSFVWNEYGPGSALAYLWLRLRAVSLTDPRAMSSSAVDVYSDSHTYVASDRGVGPSRGSATLEPELLDPDTSTAQQRIEAAPHLHDAARLIGDHTDAGPDDAGDLRYDRVRTVVDAARIPLELKGIVGTIAEPLDVINETYTKIFPAVAAADMSDDLERFEESPTDFALNCYYLRMPRETLAPRLGPRYHSRLVGPNRPNANPTTKNMLAALIKRNADANVIKIAEDRDLSHRVWENFKRTYCRPDIDGHLRQLQQQPLVESYPLFMNWLESADGRKVASIVATLVSEDAQLRDLPLNEFVAMFKGQSKPTLSSAAHKLYAKFQTIVYYEDKTINSFWSTLMRDVAARFESCLAPQVYVALRGDRKLREDHLSQYWPYGQQDIAYIQVDISEYDKSQESRTRDLEDLIFTQLGMHNDYVDKWSYSHIDTTIRVLAMGIKMVVAYQRKSGDATTALGNVMLNMMASAYVFGKPIVSIAQGDDGLILRPFGGLDYSKVADQYAQLFNLPVKLIVQHTTLSSIPYAMSCFYVPDVEAKRVYVVPDPVRAVESHSKSLTSDDDKFREKWESYQDRVKMWRAPYPLRDFARMFQSWYECPSVDTERFMLSMVSMGETAEIYRRFWLEELR